MFCALAKCFTEVIKTRRTKVNFIYMVGTLAEPESEEIYLMEEFYASSGLSVHSIVLPLCVRERGRCGSTFKFHKKSPPPTAHYPQHGVDGGKA